VTAPEPPRVRELYRYPVKGLSGESLASFTIGPGETVPFDRAWAIENGPSRFDPAQPKHLPKINFLMLMRNERLAGLEARFEEATQTLVLLRAGKQVARGELATSIGRQIIEQFFAAYMQGELKGPPKVLSVPGHSFSDVAAKCLHVVNLASLREVERMAGRPVDRRRFRANVYIDGVQPWAEFQWLGRRMRIGGIEVEGYRRTGRCEATNVDPVTAQRDMTVPALLQRTWGHSDFGIYAEVVSGGSISVGDAVKPV
jgi:uncharacterized protein YcbX